jgi:peptide/nickel transport system substrate-binding protein
VTAIEEADHAKAIEMLKAEEIHMYTFGMMDPELFKTVVEDPNLHYEAVFGAFNELTFNPVGPIFPGTGKLNPFAIPRMREAMNWLVDRTYITEEFQGGRGVPRYFPLHPAFPDYARYAPLVRELELKYAHDPEKAKEIITEEMEKLGAELVEGKWLYEGEPVVIKMLIRVEDERLKIGDYVADLLEELGFETERMYKTAAEASPIWIHGDPADGEYHIYTGGWIATVISRDQGGVFDFFYTPRGLGLPLWMAYTPAPEFDEVSKKLAIRDYASLEEREELFAKALKLAMEDSVRVWLTNRVGFQPRREEVRVAADLAGGISGAFLWALTSRFVDVVGGELKIAMPSILPDPWNPLDGSNWIYDMMLIRSTADWGTIWDPFTGLHWPQRIEKAEIYVKEGLPVGITHDWLTLEFVPEIEVPADAWIDWDAVEQKFITVGEKHPEGLTAKVRAVIYYPEELYEIKWHDGSTFDLADIMLGMILTFDRAKEESPIYDAAEVPDFETFMEHFRGVRILSEKPLVIESYTDLYYLDAEWIASGWTWDWYYAQGPGAWHNIAIGILAETDKELAFSAAKADELEVEWMSYIAGPSLDILEQDLEKAIAENYIPYEPTLGEYITAEEASARYAALKSWYEEKGHFWIGTGPLYLEKAYPVEKIVHLKRFPEFPDLAEKWVGFVEPRIAEAVVSGPSTVSIGKEATFDIEVTFKAEPYPVADVGFVKYLLIDAEGKVALVGEAEAIEDGLWKVTLTAEETKGLIAGSNRLEVAVSPLVVAIPSFASFEFVTVP